MAHKSASEYDGSSYYAYYWNIAYDGGSTSWDSSFKLDGLSVRCVKD